MAGGESISDLEILAFLYLEPVQGSPIEGESMDALHKGELQVTEFKMELKNIRKGTAGPGDTRPKFGEMTFNVVPSKASPALMMAVARSDQFKKATLSVRKRGAKVDYLQIQLCNVYITSYQHNGGASKKDGEDITLNYALIDFFYAQQEPDGTIGKNKTSRAWSLSDNKDPPSMLPYTPKK
jgi:type VI secretion system secreted protein Hcp